MKNRRKILLRFDDICPTMEWKQWGRAMALLDQTGVKALLGVIPDCQDPDLLIDQPREDFWEYMKGLQTQGYTIAMHGYQHVFDAAQHGILNRRMNSEFSGLPLQEQREKIRKGKDILLCHGIETDVFFAPAHSYDENTLIALYENGFRYISDGKSSKPYIWHGITCLPCRNGGAARIGGAGFYTSVFHAHEWVRKDKASAYDALRATLQSYSPNIVPFEDYKRQVPGNLWAQQTIERLYIRWEYDIRPVMSRIYHRLR